MAERRIPGKLRGVLLGALALAHAAQARADEPVIPPASFPKLQISAAGASAFAPAGWTVEAEAAGDLNGDSLADIVFVLREANPANLVTVGSTPLNTNPRILAAAFGVPGGGFRLALENHRLIPRHLEPSLDDAFDKDDGLAVARGAFSVQLGFFASMGSWETSRTKLTFKAANGRFELIGYDRFTTMRNTGRTSAVSINYLTGRVRRETGSIEHDRGDVRWSDLPKRPRPTIDTVGDGLEFDPKP